MNLFDKLVVSSLPLIPKAVVGKIASRYIAGESIQDAVNAVRRLNEQGFRCTVDVLGEFVSERTEADRGADLYIQFLGKIVSENLNSNISVKLTAMGLSIDRQFAKENFQRILDVAAEHKNFVRIDMEDSPYTDETLNIYAESRVKYNTGIVIQAYLRRSMEDVKRLMQNGKSNFRLCKGIYVEPDTIAIKDKEEIRSNYLLLLKQMVDGGAYVGIATHDDYIIKESEKILLDRKVSKDSYEFQMLLGVLPNLRDHVLSRGHHVRIYVPFGQAWYGYSTRRLKENPQIAGYVFKSLFGK